MYYSEKARIRKVKELENNKKFMDYAHEQYDQETIKRWNEDTFEKYLLERVFELDDNFTMIQFLENSDQETIDRVLSEALKGLPL